jgi:hypothetical protein
VAFSLQIDPDAAVLKRKRLHADTPVLETLRLARLKRGAAAEQGKGEQDAPVPEEYDTRVFQTAARSLEPPAEKRLGNGCEEKQKRRRGGDQDDERNEDVIRRKFSLTHAPLFTRSRAFRAGIAGVMLLYWQAGPRDRRFLGRKKESCLERQQCW